MDDAGQAWLRRQLRADHGPLGGAQFGRVRLATGCQAELLITGGPFLDQDGVAGWQLPTPTSAASAVALGGKVYLAGGLTPTGGSSAAILRIDPLQGTVAPSGTLAQQSSITSAR